ncbi:zinc-binding dehydrogenase [Streptomyces sp. NPDC005953]|uniref:zinc-binding dehydrogenase n=1 Tax=Streptomyces sp. NPDC005953 TaxID=3156719 RepID=UPI003404A0C0
MKAVMHTRHGGPSTLELRELPDPEPGPGEVLIAVRAAGVNRLDLLQRQGPGVLPGFSLPHIPGMDISGDIIGLGPGVNGRHIGDRVVVNPGVACGTCAQCTIGQDAYCSHVQIIGGNRPGGYAELVVVPATHTHVLPPGTSHVAAAALPTAYGMAWQALVVRGELRADETVLVHGGGSGVSMAAVHIARRIGARVIVTSGSDEKLAHMAQVGAHATINNRTEDVAARARELTDGTGVDLVLDHVGPALFQASLHSLRLRGRLVFCGDTTGATAAFHLPHAFHCGITLLGAGSCGFADFGAMIDFCFGDGGGIEGELEPVVDTLLPLAEAAVAHHRLESGETKGKIVLLPGNAAIRSSGQRTNSVARASKSTPAVSSSAASTASVSSIGRRIAGAIDERPRAIDERPPTAPPQPESAATPKVPMHS